ncbi:dynein regulatory complex subunit 6 isoform X6 [Argonauta hians]
MTALAIKCPEDPYQFIIKKLWDMKQRGLETVRWDMFIEDCARSKRGLYFRRYEFSFEGDEDKNVMRELYLRAYEFYNLKLKNRGFNAILGHWKTCKQKKEEVVFKVLRIQTQRQYKFVSATFYVWKDWTQQIVQRYATAQTLLDHVWLVQLSKNIFTVWQHLTLESIQQKHYFEKLEKGENIESSRNTDSTENNGNNSTDSSVPDKISSLPYKLGVLIFSYLTPVDLAHCATVCCSWKILTNDNILRCKLNIHEIKDRVTASGVCQLIQRCHQHLQHLNLRDCRHIDDSAFLAITSCNNLQDLNLSNCTPLKDDHIVVIAQQCRILSYLNISHTLITDVTLTAIAQYLKNLLCLSVAYCTKFTDQGMVSLTEGECCKSLQHLDISNCLQITPEGFHSISNKCKNLKVLIIDEFPTLTDQCIQRILQNCSKLESVSFLGSPLLSDASFQKLPKSLKTIKLEGNHRVSDLSIKLLSRMCPGISYISLTDCHRVSDISLRYLATCKQLTVLNLAECIKFQNLTYLSLNYCDNISEASLEVLGQAPNLVSLDISGSCCSDQSISSIGKRKKIRILTVSQCTNFSDVGLQKFAKQCQGLEQIDLSECLQITDNAIKNLAFCCRLLSCVKLSGCKEITDLTLQYLSGVCHYIVQLDLNRCTHITDKGMKFLLKGCPWLRILNIVYCTAVSKSVVKKLQRSIETVSYREEEDKEKKEDKDDGDDGGKERVDI